MIKIQIVYTLKAYGRNTEISQTWSLILDPVSALLGQTNTTCHIVYLTLEHNATILINNSFSLMWTEMDSAAAPAAPGQTGLQLTHNTDPIASEHLTAKTATFLETIQFPL